VCERVCDIYPKNYMAWTHRLVLLDLFPDVTDLQTELASTLSWVGRHVSDHAGLHHLQATLTCLDRRLPPSEGATLLTEQLSFVHELIWRYPGHEALWCHLRFLVFFSLSRLARSGSVDPFFALEPIDTPTTCAEEVAFSQDCEVEDNGVERYEEQRQLALSFRLWIVVLARQHTQESERIRWLDGVKKEAADALGRLVSSPAIYTQALKRGWPPV